MSEVITVSEIGQKKLIEQFPSINNDNFSAVMSEAGGNYESKQFEIRLLIETKNRIFFEYEKSSN